jgi:hypothetical protein
MTGGSDRTRDDTAPPEAVEDIRDSIDLSEIWETGNEDIGIYERMSHKNGDETIVQLCSFGNGWQVIAIDVDRGGEVLEIETVGHTKEHERAVGMAEFWTQNNPDGVLGSVPDDDGGVLAALTELLDGGGA